MGSSGRIRGEEQSALALTVRLTPLLTKALQDIQAVLSLVAKARGHANNVEGLYKAQSNSPTEKMRLDEKARQAYSGFKETIMLLRQSVKRTENAISDMSQCISPLRGIEQYSKQLEKEFSSVDTPSGKRQIAFEEGILSSAKNVASGIELNIQRCRAIKAKLTTFLTRANAVFQPEPGRNPTMFAVSVIQLKEELEQLQMWYTAAFNSILHINAIVDKVARLETAILRQGLSTR